jgi:hypothetical protein
LEGLGVGNCLVKWFDEFLGVADVGSGWFKVIFQFQWLVCAGADCFCVGHQFLAHLGFVQK